MLSSVQASRILRIFDFGWRIRSCRMRRMTKPLFAIPPHQFFFNPGTTEKQFFTNMLQMEDTEFDLISKAQNGECLFRCGSDRYMMKVIAPEHKAKLFGIKGGK